MDMTDRLSELPEFILHDIISILDPKEVCRTSVLSKKWYGVWASIPVLVFQPGFLENWDICRGDYGYWNRRHDHKYEHLVAFIDKIMQRYSTQKYRIKKLTIDLPMCSETLQPLVDKWVDKWVRIAVENQIEELVINLSKYRLPAVLFTAKSLKVLKCLSGQLPYNETIELISLEYLTLCQGWGNVDDDMLQRIISFCPLVELDVRYDIRKSISIPWTRKVNKGAECFGSGTMQANLKTSPLRRLYYHSDCLDMNGVCVDINVVALKNLRKLEIEGADITDCIVSELVYGLESLESLRLRRCSKLRCIKISTISLKEFRIEQCLNLITATIDAPNLLVFWYNCEVESSLFFIRTQDPCNAYCFPSVIFITTAWFVKLKKFLTETNIFKYLVMDLSNSEQDLLEINEDQLRNVATSPPYKLKELKLRATFGWHFARPCIMAFLDGLFWSCHPDVLSITSNYFDNSGTQLIVETLKRKVKCWKHPLKNIEVEGIDSSRLLSDPSEHEIRLRLSWSSF